MTARNRKDGMDPQRLAELAQEVQQLTGELLGNYGPEAQRRALSGIESTAILAGSGMAELGRDMEIALAFRKLVYKLAGGRTYARVRAPRLPAALLPAPPHRVKQTLERAMESWAGDPLVENSQKELMGILDKFSSDRRAALEFAKSLVIGPFLFSLPASLWLGLERDEAVWFLSPAFVMAGGIGCLMARFAVAAEWLRSHPLLAQQFALTIRWLLIPVVLFLPVATLILLFLGTGIGGLLYMLQGHFDLLSLGLSLLATVLSYFYGKHLHTLWYFLASAPVYRH